MYVQKLANGHVRSGGFHTLNGVRSGELQRFCYVGDAVGSPKVFFGSGNRHGIYTSYGYSAMVTYTKESVCHNCNSQCGQQQPVVMCAWGDEATGAYQYYGKDSVPVQSMSPVREVWDGLAARTDASGARGDYNVDMNAHAYSYVVGSSVADYCTTCQNSTLTTVDKPHNWQSWGRRGGKSGFLERNAHNIYDSGADHEDEVYTDDPASAEWDVCTGSVPGSACSATPLAAPQDIEIDVVTFIPEAYADVPQLPPMVDWTYKPKKCPGRTMVGTGDARGFRYGGSFRTRQVGAFVIGSSYGELFSRPAYTEVFDEATSVVNGQITFDAANDQIKGDCYRKHFSGQGTRYNWRNIPMQVNGSTAWIKIEGESGTPAMYTPLCGSCITWKYGLYLSAIPGTNLVDVTLQAEHDGFPNYEVYVDQQLVYSSDHNALGQNGTTVADLWWLAPPTDVRAQVTKRVINQ